MYLIWESPPAGGGLQKIPPPTLTGGDLPPSNIILPISDVFMFSDVLAAKGKQHKIDQIDQYFTYYQNGPKLVKNGSRSPKTTPYLENKGQNSKSASIWL